jgi:hypothetical protein
MNDGFLEDVPAVVTAVDDVAEIAAVHDGKLDGHRRRAREIW